MNQRAPISSGLIARKGAATTSSAIESPKPAPAPAPPVAVIVPDKAEAAPRGEPGVPLNFNVPASFKKRFALAALHEDKNHKQFLLWLFDQYEASTAKAG